MKLTEEQREEAKRQLVNRLEATIEETPRGVTEGEIRECILKAAYNLKLIVWRDILRQ